MEYPSHPTIFSLIEEKSRVAPKHIALVDGLTSKTYEDFYSSVLIVSDYLLGMGVNRGNPIMLVGENSIALCTLLLAAAKIGVCVVMENARRVSPEIKKIIDCSRPSHIFYLHANSEDAKRHSFDATADLVSTPELGEFGLVRGLIAEPPNHIDADVAIIIYTTGSTGTPKGVMLTHDNLLYIARMMMRYRSIGSSDKIYAVLPFTHVMGCASVLLGGLHGGATLFLVSKFNPKECLDLILNHGITVMQGAPAMFSKIIEYCSLNEITHLETLRFIGSGGAPLDKDLKKRTKQLFGCDLQNGYGLTEAASISWTRMDESNDDDSVGRLLEGVEVSFRDSNFNVVSNGETGELWCRGPNLMRGYFNDSTLTSAAIDPKGWFNTGDLGFQHSDGRIFIVGRTKDLIIKSGFNVYPLEIEALLNSHPDIIHSAVVGKRVHGNEEIHVFVEINKNSSFSSMDIAAFLAANLSPYKRPDRIHILSSLPLSANGKVLKSQLLLEHAHY